MWSDIMEYKKMQERVLNMLNQDFVFAEFGKIIAFSHLCDIFRMVRVWHDYGGQVINNI